LPNRTFKLVDCPGGKSTTTTIPELLEGWSADYLHELHHRQRWHRSSHNIQPGDPVILREDNSAPFHWTTAFIKDVHPGADGNMSGHYQNPKG